MKTLRLRDVPDDVLDRLERLAQLDGITVNEVAIRELASATRRVENAVLLATLPDQGLETADLVAAIEAERER